MLLNTKESYFYISTLEEFICGTNNKIKIIFSGSFHVVKMIRKTFHRCHSILLFKIFFTLKNIIFRSLKNGFVFIKFIFIFIQIILLNYKCNIFFLTSVCQYQH